MKIKKKILIVTFLAAGLAPSMVAQASLQSEMDGWFADGGFTNSSGGGAYESQLGGFYHGGNMSARVPTRTIGNWVGVQPPRFEGGCGGIDMDLGGFSFVNKDQIVQQLRAIGQNAKALAFTMAIKYISAQLAGTMETIKGWADTLNGIQINSCDAAANMLAFAGDGIGEALGKDAQGCIQVQVAKNGLSHDEARSVCTSGGGRNSTMLAERNQRFFTEGNVAWYAMMQSQWLRNDLDLAELLMSMTGTLIVTKQDTGASTVPVPHYYPSFVNEGGAGGPGQASLSMKMALDGMIFGGTTSGLKGSVPMLKCDSADRSGTEMSCRSLANGGKPTWTPMDTTVGIKKKVRDAVDGIYTKIYTRDQALSTQEVALIESSAVPIYRYILASASAFRNTSSAQDERLDKYLDVVSKEIVATSLAAMLDNVKYSLSMENLNPEGDRYKKDYLKNVEGVQSELMSIREDSQKQMDKVIEMMQLSQQYERVVISRMSVGTFNSAMFGR